MASRIYLPSSGSAPASPAYDSWSVTTQASRLPCYTTKQGTSMANASITGDADKTNKSYLIRQWVSETLGGQTIASQTVKLQIRGLETNAANNLFVAISIRSWNGSTFQQILSITLDGTELATGTATNRQFSATTTARTVAAGDRLVIEIGVSGDPAQTGSDYHNSTLRIGDASGSDLPENDSDTNDYNPWVEFPNTVGFLSTSTQTIQAKARMKTADLTKTVTAKGRVKQPDQTKTVTAKAKITYLLTKTIQAKARVKNTVPKQMEYSFSNQDNDEWVYTNDQYSQSFISAGGDLDSIVLLLKQNQTPTGNAYVKLYAHTGIFGISSEPTGAALATSDALDVSTLTTNYQQIKFNFTGANRYAMTEGTAYCFTIEYGDGVAMGNDLVVGSDHTAPTDAGNLAWGKTGGWTPESGWDLCFRLLSTKNLITARGKIFNTTTRTVTSKGRVKYVDQTKTVTAKAKIAAAPPETEATEKYWWFGLPAEGLQVSGEDAGGEKYWWMGLPAEYLFPPSGAAEASIQAKARIKQGDVTKTIQAKGRIKYVDQTNTIQAKGRVKATATQTIQAKGRMKATATQTVQAKGRIKTPDITKTIQAKGRVKIANITNTVQAKGRVKQTIDNTVQAKGRIKTVDQTKTITAKGRVKTTATQTSQAKGRILNTATQTIQAKGKIMSGSTQTIQAKGRIKTTDVTKTVDAKGRVLRTEDKTVQAKAKIAAAALQSTVDAKGRIQKTETQTVQAKGRVKRIPGMDFEHAYEMIQTGLYVSGSDDNWLSKSSRTYLDTNDFDGTVTYFFEIIGTTYGYGSNCDVYLVDSSENIKTTLTLENSVNAPKRYRGSFTPNAGNDYYQIKFGSLDSDRYVFKARIIIRQLGATKTKIQRIGVGWHDESCQLQFPAADLWYLSDWNKEDESFHGRWHRDDDWLKNLSPAPDACSLEVQAYLDGFGGDVNQVALYNVTDDVVVEDSITSFSYDWGDSIDWEYPTYKITKFSASAANFLTGKDYEVRSRSLNEIEGGYFYKANLYLKLINLEKLEVMRLATYYYSYNDVMDYNRLLIEPSRFSNPKFFYEAMGYGDALARSKPSLLDVGTSDVGTSGTKITNSEFSMTHYYPNIGIDRSSEFSMVEGNRAVPQSTGTANDAGYYQKNLVIQCQIYHLSRDIRAKANIFNTVNRSIQGKSRLLKTEDKTVQAKAKISKLSTQTIDAKGRIKNTVDQTVTARGYILNAGAATVQAKGRVKQVDVTKTVQAKGRVKQADQTKTVTAKSRIKKTVDQTVTARGRVKQVDQTKTVQSKGRIKQADQTKTVTAKGRVKVTQTQTIQAKGRVKQTDVTKTVQAKGRIKQPSLTNTIQAKGRVKATQDNTVQARGNIKNAVDRTVQAKAAISTGAITRTVQAKARMQRTETQTIDGRGRIKQADQTKTIQAKGRLLKGGTATIQAKGSIRTGADQTIQSKGRVKQLGQTKSATAKSRVLKIGTATVQAKARMKPTATKTVDAKGRIKGTATQTVDAKGRVKQAGLTKTIQAKAKLWAARLGNIRGKRALYGKVGVQDNRLNQTGYRSTSGIKFGTRARKKG